MLRQAFEGAAMEHQRAMAVVLHGRYLADIDFMVASGIERIGTAFEMLGNPPIRRRAAATQNPSGFRTQ
jgi:hypothetical protein